MPGKTTLAYLVARLYDADEGAVRIDGHDVRTLTLDCVSEAIGLVTQETYLFHDTLGANLRFAAPEASDADLDAAVRAARVDGVVRALPDGYDTVVGARGYRFSGGERQRLAIARMLLRNPRILILDEATSALDTETERAVQAALDELAARTHHHRHRAPALDRASTPTRSSCSTRGASSNAGSTTSC